MFPYLIPEAGRHHFVDARISQYGKLVIFYSKVEQYAVTRFRARYAQNTEDFTRAFRQRFPRMAFQVNLDFAGRLFFSVQDRLAYLLLLYDSEKIPLIRSELYLGNLLSFRLSIEISAFLESIYTCQDVSGKLF